MVKMSITFSFWKILSTALFFSFYPFCLAEETRGRLSANDLDPGTSSTFFFTNDVSSSGESCGASQGQDCCAGTIESTYSGITHFSTSYCKGRYNGLSSVARQGFGFDTFYLFRSILNNRQVVVVNSNAGCTNNNCCPASSRNYNWLTVRGLSPDDYRAPMDVSLDSTWIGGKIDYDPANLSNQWSSNYRFSLSRMGQTPRANTDAYGAKLFGSSTCSGGEFKADNLVRSNSGVVTFSTDNRPLGNYGYWLFGKSLAIYRQATGDPRISVAVPAPASSTLASDLLSRNKMVFSGLMSFFKSRTEQVQKNIFLVPDSLGTTFSIKEASSLSNPQSNSSLGTLACTNTDYPSNGFCYGSLTLSDVPGSSGKAVCLLTFGISQKDLIFCSAQTPATDSTLDKRYLATIFAGSSHKSVVEFTSTPLHIASNGATTGNVCATLENKTSRSISSLSKITNFSGNFSGGSLSGNLTTPFSYDGSVATCGSALPAFSRCKICATYTNTDLGVHAHNLQVGYDASSEANSTKSVTLVGSRGVTAVELANPKVTVGKTPSKRVRLSDNSIQNVDALPDSVWSCGGGSCSVSNTPGTESISFTLKGLDSLIGSSATYSGTVQVVSGEGICYDSADDDADSSTDCADLDCDGALASASSVATCTFGSELICTDSVDNDGDGQTDAADSNCLPNAPTGLSGTAGNGTVALSWTAASGGGGLSVTDYVIQYSTNSGSSWSNFGNSGLASATVSNLTNGYYYVFRVAARNAAGVGPYSANSSTIRPVPQACAGDCYLEGTSPNYAQGLTVGTTRQGPGTAFLELVYANGASGFKIWKELGGGGRLLNASGLISKGWQKPLTASGTSFQSSTGNVSSYSSSIGGRVCPPSTFMNFADMVATDRCLYYDTGNSKQALDKDFSFSSEATSWLQGWDSASTGNGTGASWFEGNIKTCADKGMRLPTLYETTSGNPGSNIPSDDTPTFAGASNGVPSGAIDYDGPTWTASAYSATTTGYWNYLTGVSSGFDFYMDDSYYIRCVLPESSTTPDSPTAVSGTVGHAAINLSWNAPSSDGGSPITDYRIQFSSNGGSSWSTYSDGTSTSTSATIPYLTNGTPYIFRVAAINSSGVGNYSSPSSAMTPNEVCGGAGNGCYDDNQAKTNQMATLLDGNENSTNPTILEYVTASGSFKIWREKNIASGQSVKRVLHASGLWSNGWQYKLNASGKGFSATLFDGTNDISHLSNRACPSNSTLPSVFINDDSAANKFSTGYCLYYDAGTGSQLALNASSSGTIGEDYLPAWTDSSSALGSSGAWYEGNVATCKTKGMRLPTAFETRMNQPANTYLPTGDGDPTSSSSPKPIFAGGNGVPNTTGYTWTATANSTTNNRYYSWSGTTSGQRDYNLSNYVRCVLP